MHELLPNFLGIGAERCATTWIYECLREHPEVFLSDEKEIHFFSWNFGKGLDWYAKHFLGSVGKKAFGEISPEYIYIQEAPQRIKNTIPEARLILSLRNPIERALSQYGWHVLRNLHEPTFREAIAKYPDHIAKGFYDKQLQRYLDLFNDNQILVLIYEDLENDPLSFIRKIYHFLSLDLTFVPSVLRLNRNRGVTKTDSTLVRLYRDGVSLTVTMDAYPVFRPVIAAMRRLRKLGFVSDLLEQTLTKHTKAQIDSQTRNYLREVFFKHNKKLSTMLGRDLTTIWN